MRLLTLITALLLAMGLHAQTGTGQTPPAQNPPGSPDQTVPDPTKDKQKLNDPKRPEDPLSEREKLIRQFDPLSKPDTETPPTGTVPNKTNSPFSAKPFGTNQKPNAQPVVQGSQVVSAAALEAGDDVKIIDSGAKDQDADLTREYAGPAVLTRTYAVERPSLPENSKFQPFVGIRQVADTGLNSISNATTGKPINRFSYGDLINFGIDGRHYWRHDLLQASFSGDYSYYGANSGFNGLNISGSLDYTHVVTRRIRLSVVNHTSHFSRNNNLSNPSLSPDLTVANVNLSTNPNAQIFDQSTTQSSNTVSLTWQQSARISFNFSGTSFFVKRGGNGLINSQGLQAAADYSYRMSKRTTAGLYYAYSYYKFSGGLGNTSTNSLGLIFSHSFTGRTELRLRGGVSQVENLGITSVSIDPTIAALLGQTAGLVQLYSKSTPGDFSASLTRDLRRNRSAHVAFNRSTSPGNGVFLTSTQTLYDAGFDFKLARRYNASIGVGQTTLQSQSQMIGSYGNDFARFSASRKLQKDMEAVFTFDYRHFQITNTPMLRNQYRITLGFSWSNPDFPRRVL